MLHWACNNTTWCQILNVCQGHKRRSMGSDISLFSPEIQKVVWRQRQTTVFRCTTNSRCETLNHVKLVTVDSAETADYYKENNPKLFGGLGRMSGGDCSIRLREDAVPFALSTRVNPFGGCRQAGATEDGRSSSDQACGHTYGLVCGHGSRGQAHSLFYSRGRRKGDT